jgi:hypothetical protein
LPSTNTTEVKERRISESEQEQFSIILEASFQISTFVIESEQVLPVEFLESLNQLIIHSNQLEIYLTIKQKTLQTPSFSIPITILCLFDPIFEMKLFNSFSSFVLQFL